MEKDLKGKVVLVTGGGRGIGKACALAFAARGCRVAVLSRTRGEVDAVAETVRSAGGEAFSCSADVADEAAVVKAFQEIGRLWGAVDVLVNNAAIFSRASVADHGAREWDAVMAVNVRGVFLCTRQLFRDCAAAGKGGSVVNIASLAGVRRTEKFPGLSSYVASKFAVVGMTEAFAVEGRALGVRVNCVAPGAVDTEMLRQAAPHLKTQVKPAQIAQTVLVLADDALSAHLTGSVLEIFSNAS